MLLCFACSNDHPPQPNISSLKIAVLPDQSKERLLIRYQPLLDYLTKETNITFSLITLDSYKDAINQFKNKSVDIIRLGGVTFLQANHTANAQPLVMRDVDTKFESHFFTRIDHPNNKMADFKNHSISFGSKISTSGHLMPRHFLNKNWGIEPESFYKNIIYSGAHDKTIELVLQGKVDFGVANSIVLENFINSNNIDNKKIKLIWKSPPYTDYVWSVQDTLPQFITDKLMDAFLKLDINNPNHKPILDILNANAFFPASTQDFEILKNIVLQQGLIK